jgi:UDPglucose--hexose-1-phosphate uridylyltransferase
VFAASDPVLAQVEPAGSALIDPGGPMLRHGANPARDLFWAAPAVGTHEHLPFPARAELSADAVAAALEGWRERIRAHDEAACVHVCVDPALEGAQLYALESVPQLVAREREHFGAYATRTMGGNLLADLVQEEVRHRERIVAIDEECVLIAPFGSRVPYQLVIAPRTPRLRYEDDGPAGAAMLFDALRRLTALLGDSAAPHVFVRTAPRGAEFFCWRIELLPVEPGGASGLELGTGLQLNAVAPEQAAASLRDL